MEKGQAARGSVRGTLRHEEKIAPVNVTAIANLVASAVEGLAPGQVTIVDARGDLLNKPRATGSLGEMPTAQLEYRAAIERDLQNKLSQTLDPVLGAGNYRTGVSVECDFAGVEENEEVWDPTKSVMVSSQRTEESTGSAQTSAGVPGTQANLPDPPPRPAGSTGTTRRTESSNYQTSRKVRHVEQSRGEVKRITVAVLLDQESHWEGDGSAKKRVFVAPAAEKIAVIKNLVTNVAGLNQTRGDQLTVESLPFDGTIRDEPPGTQPAAQPQATPVGTLASRLKTDHMLQGEIGGGVLVLLLAVGMLLRKMRSPKPAAEVANPQIAAGTGAAAHGQTAAPSRAITSGFTPEEQASLEQDLMESLKLPSNTVSKAETLTKFLRQEIKKDPQAATQLLRAWLLEEEH